MDGVLGGFGHVSPVDIRDSSIFLVSESSECAAICVFYPRARTLRVPRAPRPRQTPQSPRPPLRRLAPQRSAFQGPLKEKAEGKRRLVALDCGAGVGRVTEELLLHHFDVVDLCEPVVVRYPAYVAAIAMMSV